MAIVVWTLGARRDLQSIDSYIADYSTAHATAVVDALVAGSERLAHFPMLGRTVPEVGDPAVRELIIKGYRLIYVVRVPEDVAIVAVLHGAMDLEASRERRPWLID